MFKYLVVLTVAGAVIYTSQHPELLGLLDSSPSFKVWVNQTHIPPNNSPFNILNVQSREDKPIAVKRVLMNDDPNCVKMQLSPYRLDSPVKLGEVIRFPLGQPNLGACDPVKVLISTDRGESVYHFN